MTSGWRWLTLGLVHAIHDRQLAEHGGLDGLRDKAALESALARPKNRAAYELPDAAELAASYGHGIAKAHAFLDGNKRVAWVAARVFLADNGCRVAFDPFDAIRTMEGVASGQVTEGMLAEWFRVRLSGDRIGPRPFAIAEPRTPYGGQRRSLGFNSPWPPSHGRGGRSARASPSSGSARRRPRAARSRSPCGRGP